MFQNCFRTSKLQEFFTTYKWLYCTWCIKKIYSLEYNKIKECEILILGENLKFWSFFKLKQWIYKESAHFLKIIFIQSCQKKMWCIGENLNIF
jgi:hypothetical protein